MYDLPELRWATDAMWQCLARELAARGIAAPAELDRRADHRAVWHEPRLLLSQTCGYPYAAHLRGKVRLVATPCYRADGHADAHYRSLLLVRRDDPADGLADLRGRRVAFNELDSQSGHNTLRAVVAPLAQDGRFFAASLATGGHRASIAAVTEGRADLCAVDCVTWALLCRHEPERTGKLRPIGWTAVAAALPLITAWDGPVDALRAALAAVAADPGLAAAREALLLDGFAIRDDADYDRILLMEQDAIARGYPALA
ncbi:MAG: PhnD/SsuA/transferrin family substrate-binding protein [Geminicoccaceae bacterium]